MMTTAKQYFVSLSTSLVAMSLLLPQTALASIDEPVELRISNGKQANECNFPGVVLLSNCTGTLVHPKMVVYAAHCGKRQTVTLTHGSGGGAKLAVERCNTNPKYGSASQEHLDWAYCILKEEAKGWPIIPVAAGCEMDLLAKNGGEVTQCGFGRSNDGGPSFGRKRYAASKISRVSAGDITVGDDGGVVACPGDSGGPLLARLEDGSWRTIGITSTYNGQCGKGGMNTYANIAGALAWIEKDSGIDITPCFTSSGEWEPGPGCGGFFAGDPDSASGTWSNKCEGTKLSGLSTTCGSQGPDKDAPEVELKSPGEEELVEPAKLTIEATAKDNVKVKSVELFVNDKSKGKVDKEPFSWTLEDLDAGEYELKAVAVDDAKNEGESKVITIEVGKGESDSSDPDKDDDASNVNSEKSDADSNDDGASDDDDGSEDGDGSDDEGSEEGSQEDSDEGKSNAKGDDDDEKPPKKGCAVESSPQHPSTWLMALAGLMLLRRRRS